MNRIKKENLKRLKSIILITEVSVFFGSSDIDKETIERAKKYIMT